MILPPEVIHWASVSGVTLQRGDEEQTVGQQFSPFLHLSSTSSAYRAVL
jgi:hypothetical protein